MALHAKTTGGAAPKRRGFHSLTFEFFVLFFGLIGGAILLILLANTFLLGRYYVSEKQKDLTGAYEQLNRASLSNSIGSDEFDVELVRITSKGNISCIVIDEESQTVKAYAADTQTMVRRMWDNIFDTTEKLPENFSPEDERSWKGADDDFYLVAVLSRKYGQVTQIVLDRRTNTQYMEQWGMLENGNYYLLSTAVESIRSNAMIANHFILYVGLAVLLLGLVVAMVLGSRITRPIRQLTSISQRMKRLDFSAKYEGHDTTEIGELGENINDMSATLEKTISELKTANNELKSDLAHKEEVEKMQQEFISNVTHELKTPIALIQGYAEGLQDGITDDKESQDFYTGVIIDEAGKMNGIVQKLLQLMHLEFGQSEVKMQQFDVVEVIRGYLQSSNLLATEKEVRLRFSEGERADIPPEEIPPIMVWADEFLTEEVFQNYFTNALNHIEGDKIIDIRFEQKENCVRISVFNTGKPIPEESLPRIWEKFYKVDKARTREYGGSGVGLSIVRAIQESMHQQYGVINYDNGVEFWFELDTTKR